MRSSAVGGRQLAFAATVYKLRNAFMQLKVLLDAPAASDLVSVHRNQLGAPVYTASMAGNVVLARYRALFGGQSNVKKHDLPRRVLGRRVKNKGWAAFKRERKQEQQEEPMAMETEAADALQGEAMRSAAARQTTEQENLLKSLKNEVKEALQDFDAPSIKKKIASHRKIRSERERNISSQELRDLAAQPACLHGDSIVVVVGTRSDANKPLFDSLAAVGGPVKVMDMAEAKKSIPELLENQLVWLFPSADKMASFVRPYGVGLAIERAADDTIRKQAVSSAIRHILPRLVGGYLAGSSWLQVQQELGVGLRTLSRLTDHNPWPYAIDLQPRTANPFACPRKLGAAALRW